MPLPGKAVAVGEALRFMVDCFKAVGACQKPAEQQAGLLLQADKMGTYSHGLNRLPLYLDDIERKLCCPNNQPEVVKQSMSTALVDAKNCLGATSSHYAMQLAIEKAKQSGAGWVVVRGANHNGIAGYWALQAAKADLIGLSFTNASPTMAPTRAKEAALGTNALAVAAPGHDGEKYYFDMSTTATSLGMIEMRCLKKIPLDIDLALDSDGNVTLDACQALKARLLMPLGGGERNSGYKGYGLAGAVEVLCGISAGADYSYKIRQWSARNSTKPANLGHCFAALNYKTFAPGFKDRLTDCIRHWRQLEPADPNKPVLAPGDKEWEFAKRADSCGSVEYIESVLKSCECIAKRLNVKPISVC